ncbi:mechanosensitive ion channel [Luminiphilus syltensis NOR5-1B]|uniref:Small-conductance mechanosensitive channel n=1 Tax=Luminiphilus syltensis NOR5-1B TaxID=565045 RepID=B8KXK4_9GAMM|nr:mechanosensitive ion channel family protein [Luminiphilus syltensis]EED36196.1 mechanosensitive ion channel [Luminiphilus syltensis NOR5-1B]
MIGRFRQLVSQWHRLCVPLALAVAIFSAPYSVADETEVDIDELAAMAEKVRSEADAIAAYGNGDLPASGERREAILFQRDQRALEWLGLFEELARRIASLPEESLLRIELRESLQSSNEALDQSFEKHLHSLEIRLNEKLAELDSASGVEAVQIDAMAEALDEQRLRYLERLIDLVIIRERLGLTSGSIEQFARQSLVSYADELVGVIEMRSASLNAIKKQASAAVENSDLQLVFDNQQRAVEQAITRLKRVVEELVRIGANTTRFRQVLIRNNSATSITLLDLDIVSDFVVRAWRSVVRWMKSSSLDITLKIVLFFAIIIFARWLARFVKVAVDRGLNRSTRQFSNLLHDVLVSFAGGAVLTIGVLVAVNQIGISVAPMLAGLGVAGFVIGFALQDTLSNFAAGAMILAYRPFDMGDYVEIAGVMGTVKYMNLVNTTISTIDNKTLIIPNGKIWGDVIQNFTGVETRRVDMIFGISYSDDIELAERVLTEIIEAMPTVLDDPPPVIRLAKLNDSSVDFIVRPWVRTEDYWETHWAVTKSVKQRFDAEGISIPFPQRDVHLHGAVPTS